MIETSPGAHAQQQAKALGESDHCVTCDQGQCVKLVKLCDM